ncbi:hypothetical protein [Streptomyces sp. NPDC002845]
MTRAGRSGSHRSKKKRLTLILAPVAALAVAVPLMANAGAATPSEVDADCKSDSDRLENCEFIPVQNQKNSFGPNERVSKPDTNCGSDTSQTKAFSVSGQVTRIMQTEEGSVFTGGAMLASSMFEVGIQFSEQDINIKRDDTTTGFTQTLRGALLPDHIGFFMWSHKRVDVSGYLKATYKEEQDGQKVFFSPSEGSTDVHVFYPQLLKNGTPDGRLWLRNVKCGTPQADAILNDGNSLRIEPGFEEGGENVVDVEVPLPETSS